MFEQPTPSSIVETLQRCAKAHDREEAVRVVLAAVEGGLKIEELYSQVLEPFLKSVGRGWQDGLVAVWEEHLIVGAIRTAVEVLYPKVLEHKMLVEPVHLTVAFFCPPEETHDLGLRMLSDRFDLRGFRTVYVGAMTPVDQMVESVRSMKAGLVCISASTHFQRAALHNVIERLRRELPEIRIVVGGPAFAHSDRGWEEYAVDSIDSLLEELTSRAITATGAEMPGGAIADETATVDEVPDDA